MDEFVPGVPVFWDDAEGFCELSGGHLVDVGTLEVGDACARGGHHGGVDLG